MTTKNFTIEMMDPRDEYPRGRTEPAEDTKNVVLVDENPLAVTKIGANLTEKGQEVLTVFLRQHADIFAWSSSDMPGIDLVVKTHHLNVDPAVTPVKQRKCQFAYERISTVREEVEKLLKAGFIREVQYPKWVSNVVMVKKSNGKWRMCVDFTDLNTVCPKDNFPLPTIDKLVDAASGHQLLSFMDAYSRYNQIEMNKAEEEQTSFITKDGLYCYTVMPFGLMNADATYQRLVNRIF